jgi:allantoin racemase
MLIKVINPNTTWAMTEKIGDCARSVAAAGTIIDAVSPTMGPASIESHYDEALSVPGVLAEIARGERDGVDGYVLACFGDPGLDAARELAGGPVVAIAEAGMKVATYLGRGFTVVTTLGPLAEPGISRRATVSTTRVATFGPARFRCSSWMSPDQPPAR